MGELKIARVKLDVGEVPIGDSILSAQDAARLLMDTFSDEPAEVFGIINMGSDGRPLNVCVISQGVLGMAPVHPRELFKASILSNAASLIMFHNHPSGNLTPSREDIELTERIIACGKLLGIKVQDHIILSPYGEHNSLRANDYVNFDIPTMNINEALSPYEAEGKQITVDDLVSHVRRVR